MACVAGPRYLDCPAGGALPRRRGALPRRGGSLAASWGAAYPGPVRWFWGLVGAVSGGWVQGRGRDVAGARCAPLHAASGVWGVLSAPPCDQFSLARNGHPDSPRDLLRGLEVVSACLRVVAVSRPRWWALENPVGLLSRFLGVAADVWEPCDFGDPWTKRTAIWGSYTLPRRGPFVPPLGGGPLCLECDPGRKTSWCSNAAHRARTPPGFAAAFFRANP